MTSLAQLLSMIGVILLVLILLAGAAVIYASRQVMRLPANNPAHFLKRGRDPSCRRVVVCAGASMVQGRVGYSFVDLLAGRFPQDCFVNAGFNGDVALHLARRLDDVIECQPDAVAILIGTNDVIGTLDVESWRRYRRNKTLSGPTSLDQYRDALREIVRRLKVGATPHIALCALPVLGEDLASIPNQRICAFNAALQEIAAQESVAYLPVFERESALLAEYQSAEGHAGRPFPTDFKTYGSLMFRAMLQHYLLGRSFDDVSRRNDFFLKTDLIHGNSREAGIIADEIAAFLKSAFAS